jgi:hypothetical protein
LTQPYSYALAGLPVGKNKFDKVFLFQRFADRIVHGAPSRVRTSFRPGLDLDQGPRADVRKLSLLLLRDIQQASCRPDHRRAYRGLCVPKTLDPTIVVMKSAQDGA